MPTCWQPPMIFNSFYNQSSHKEIMSLCSFHHLSFVNVYLSKFRSNDWVNLTILSFCFHFRLFCLKFMTVSMNLNIKLGLGYKSFTFKISF
jgi:hypothetical protein